MPSDITGTDVLEEDHATGRRAFRFIKGPLFANIVLADEINRTRPRPRRRSCRPCRSIASRRARDPPVKAPFLVFATQNPIEQEGTYPLPEAPLDRFMFQVDVGYPTSDEEVEIVKQDLRLPPLDEEGALARADPAAAGAGAPGAGRRPRRAARGRAGAGDPPPPKGQNGASTAPAVPDFIREYVAFGAGPRASQYLVLGPRPRPSSRAARRRRSRTCGRWPARRCSIG